VATALKDAYGPEIPTRIAAMICRVHRQFDARAFTQDALEHYDRLSLTARARQVAEALHRHLPENFDSACEILIASLGPKAGATEGGGIAPFIYLPHVLFVAKYGLDHFETSMRAQYELTQRFTAEFSIRAFIERYPERTLARLRNWAVDPSPHVRRLVSEGTRPRLPWATRLRMFQIDPRPVLALLELLKDDPALYVRRSVANNLNDIGKDHPELLAAIARRWLKGADDTRRWVVRHALRSAIKRAEPGALKVLGHHKRVRAAVSHVSITPRRPAIGEFVEIACRLTNQANSAERVLADLRVHFVKADRTASAKVFKLHEMTLASRQSAALSKRISLKQLSTRKHYPGRHVVELMLNGEPRLLGHFDLSQRR
jgi:3-methyladenine DNA glycosylase AlkC